MSDRPLEKVESAEAWLDFCELLKKASDVILRPELQASNFEKAEGLRYLGRLLQAGLQSFGEQIDPLHPVFRAMPDMVKMGLDNPDNYYLSATVNPQFDYRIRGKRGSIHYLSFAAQNQNFAARERISGGAGHLEDSALELDSTGGFEIIASQQERAKNWLRMNPDTSMLLVRQTFLDRLRERPIEIEIQCMQAGAPPEPLDPARVPRQLLGAAMYAIGAAQWFADWVLDFSKYAPVNQFHLPAPEQHRKVGGDPNVVVLLGNWQLAQDELLCIDVRPPTCHYWNFQLGNIWAESLDYRFRPVHLNSGSARKAPDGSVPIVVSHENPGVANWIDTAGHKRGTMGLRWVLAKEHPLPACRVIKRSQLKIRDSNFRYKNVYLAAGQVQLVRIYFIWVIAY